MKNQYSNIFYNPANFVKFPNSIEIVPFNSLLLRSLYFKNRFTKRKTKKKKNKKKNKKEKKKKRKRKEYNWKTLLGFELSQVTWEGASWHKSVIPAQFKPLSTDSNELYQSIMIFWSFSSIAFWPIYLFISKKKKNPNFKFVFFIVRKLSK